jgi:predicted transcriptional regulator
MPRKSDYRVGMEAVLNNPQTSFLTNPKVFHEIHRESGMTMAAMLKHIGRRTKAGKKPAEPTDEEKSEARLNKMEDSAK